MDTYYHDYDYNRLGYIFIGEPRSQRPLTTDRNMTNTAQLDPRIKSKNFQLVVTIFVLIAMVKPKVYLHSATLLTVFKQK